MPRVINQKLLSPRPDPATLRKSQVAAALVRFQHKRVPGWKGSMGRYRVCELVSVTMNVMRVYMSVMSIVISFIVTNVYFSSLYVLTRRIGDFILEISYCRLRIVDFLFPTSNWILQIDDFGSETS